MPGVLVDVPVVSVALVGASSPQVVQVAVAGLTAGSSVSVTGTAAGAEWSVRGGTVVADSGQVILNDVLAPLNTPIVYRVVVDGLELVSDEITVTYADKYVLQSLDGRTVIPFVWQANGLPRATALRSASYDVPGRDTPVVRWDTSGGESGSVVIRTARSATEVLRTHLRTGSPIVVMRTDGAVRDLPPAEFWLLTGAERVTWDAVLAGDVLSSDRVWSLGYQVIDDPEPSVVVAVSTWDDFDAVYAETVWSGDPVVTVRTNLAKNPRPGVLTGWSGIGSSSTTLVTDADFPGSAAIELTWNGTTTGASLPRFNIGSSTASVNEVTVGPGPVSASISYKPMTATRNMRLQVYFYDAAGVLLDATTTSGDVSCPVGVVTRVGVSTTAPANTARAFILAAAATTTGMSAGEKIRAGALLVEASATVGTYFNGGTTDTATQDYAWTGTTDASTSTETTTTVDSDTFDGEWAGGTWDEFDRVDWSTR